MNRFVVITALIGLAAAKSCSKDKNCRDAPFNGSCDGGKCGCDGSTSCEANQTLNLDSCNVCDWDACPTDACGAEGEEAWWMRKAYADGGDCSCMPAADKDPCDAYYEGAFKQADGSDCPTEDAGGDGGEGEPDSAVTLLSGALVMAAAMLF